MTLTYDTMPINLVNMLNLKDGKIIDCIKKIRNESIDSITPINYKLKLQNKFDKH